MSNFQKSNRPIVDMSAQYTASDTARFHMPGHKGIAISDLAEIYAAHITELPFSDELCHPTGVIAGAERLAAECFGVQHTLFSAGGASLCIGAMLSVSAGRRVLFDRSIHQSVINAIGLLNIDPVFTDVTIDPATGIPQPVTAMMIEPYLQQDATIAAVFVTGENYYGRCCDYELLSAVCARYNVPLLVDNAHGTHLKFLNNGRHYPGHYNTALYCDSAHKTLPVLTGGAYLHVNADGFDPALLKLHMERLASSSPSYPIMASLDGARHWCEENPLAFQQAAEQWQPIREAIAQLGYTLPLTDDPLRLVINTASKQIDARKLNHFLLERLVVCEMADVSNLVLLVSPFNRPRDFERLIQALRHAEKPDIRKSLKTDEIIPQIAFAKETVLSIREAMRRPCKAVSIDEARGKICAQSAVVYPPAIPLALPGQIISREVADYIKALAPDRLVWVVDE